MGKVEFTLNGEETCLGESPQAQRFIEFVQKIPNDKYFDCAGIAECWKVSSTFINQLFRKSSQVLEGHYLIVPARSGASQKRIFGNKKSIARLQKKLREQDII